MPKWLVGIYSFLLLGYAIWSYSQVDPNLFISFHEPFWGFQKKMWYLGFEQRSQSALIYLILCLLLFGTYGVAVRQKLSKAWVGILLTINTLTLFPAYPALSYDVFNYAMNAKMVVKYHADPHVKVAMDFPQDPWLKYMRNVHTPAPYARGWTWLSVPIGVLAGDNIKANIWIFKLLMIGAMFGVFLILNKGVSLLFLNPLFLIETVGNVHNDVVMMLLEIGALRCFLKKNYLVGLLLLAASISIKYSSVMLVLGFGIWWLGKKYRHSFSLFGSNVISHALLLFTERSKQFLPWYLIWPLTFLPETKEPWITKLIMAFSLSSMLSYVPYLYWGTYSPLQQQQRAVIQWGLPIVLLLGYELGKRIYAKAIH